MKCNKSWQDSMTGHNDFGQSPGAGINLGFLNQLTAALDKWLKVVGAEVEASMTSSNFELRWLTRNPVPPDGKMVCAALVQQVCSYKEEWQSLFDRGNDDPDAVSVPCLTKKILVNIIRQCPVVETQPGQSWGDKDCRHYSPAWLLDNVGARFHTIECLMRVPFAEVKHVRLRTHTIARGIAQANLGCTVLMRFGRVLSP